MPTQTTPAPAADVTDEAAPAEEEGAPAPAPVPVDKAMPVWTILANPVVYGLPDFKAA